MILFRHLVGDSETIHGIQVDPQYLPYAGPHGLFGLFLFPGSGKQAAFLRVKQLEAVLRAGFSLNLIGGCINREHGVQGFTGLIVLPEQFEEAFFGIVFRRDHRYGGIRLFHREILHLDILFRGGHGQHGQEHGSQEQQGCNAFQHGSSSSFPVRLSFLYDCSLFQIIGTMRTEYRTDPEK